MRVTHLLTSFRDDSGGVGVAVRGLAETLACAGASISLVDGHSGLSSLSPSLIATRFGYRRGLFARIRSTKPDLLHLHGLWQYPSIIALQWTRSTGKPLVISSHGMLQPWALAQRRRLKRLAWDLYQRHALRQAACVHALTHAEAEDIRAMGVRAPVAVIPNGVHLPRLPLRNSRRHPLKTLMYLGRLHPKKGVLEAIEGFRLFAQNAPQFASRWQFLIHGWGDPASCRSIEAAIATSKSSGARIELHGPVFGADKDAAFRTADASILASYSEGLPLSVLEAWSYGVPVFMTDACNLGLGFTKGAAVPIETAPHAIAAVLEACLHDRWLAAASDAARRLVEDRFDWSRVGGQFQALYAWLLGRSAMPDFVRLD